MLGGAVWEAKNVLVSFMKVIKDGQLCDKGIILFNDREMALNQHEFHVTCHVQKGNGK